MQAEKMFEYIECNCVTSLHILVVFVEPTAATLSLFIVFAKWNNFATRDFAPFLAAHCEFQIKIVSFKDFEDKRENLRENASYFQE